LQQPPEAVATSPPERNWIDDEFSTPPDSPPAKEEADEEASWIDAEFSTADSTNSDAAQDDEQNVNEEQSIETAPMEPPPATASRYVQLAARRNYFRMGARQESGPSSAPVSASEGSAVAQRFSVLGILTGESPRAIIRETGTNKSLILSTGQSLGEYVVREILADRIILELDGQHVELRM
jgi:hypothetical protein